MRDWEIRLAKRLKKFEDDQFLYTLLEMSTCTFYNKIQNQNLDMLTEEDFDIIEQECYEEIIQKLSKNV